MRLCSLAFEEPNFTPHLPILIDVIVQQQRI